MRVDDTMGGWVGAARDSTVPATDSCFAVKGAAESLANPGAGGLELPGRNSRDMDQDIGRRGERGAAVRADRQRGHGLAMRGKDRCGDTPHRLVGVTQIERHGISEYLGDSGRSQY